MERHTSLDLSDLYVVKPEDKKAKMCNEYINMYVYLNKNDQMGGHYLLHRKEQSCSMYHQAYRSSAVFQSI